MSRRPQPGAGPASQPPEPFRTLGLPRTAEVTDDEVRAAWRRIAAATHPDRADGGDPVAFAAAAVAYTLVRTPAARAQVLAGPPPDGRTPPGRSSGPAWLTAPVARTVGWIWRARPGRLAARAVAAVAAAIVSVAAVGWQPASAALITGALTWLILTGRRDLAQQRTPPQPERGQAEVPGTR